jgi:hypothetical protein
LKAKQKECKEHDIEGSQDVSIETEANVGLSVVLFWRQSVSLRLTAPMEEVNPLLPNDMYICRTALLTSRRCILNIYSSNIRTEYFKHAT